MERDGEVTQIETAEAGVSRTLGIDLASQAPTTAGCVIAWREGTAMVEDLRVGLDDVTLQAMADGCEKVGIDAPFGWPAPFTEFIADQVAGRPELIAWDPSRRDALRFRRTDVVVRDVLGRWPLSVSSDLIAITAMRCAGLLAALEVSDRSGTGRVVEVYPAVALRRWGQISSGYKGRAGRATVLPNLFRKLLVACPELHVPEPFARACAANDHAFDALICALVARAAAIGATDGPRAEDQGHARIEGWIAVPAADALGRLTFRDAGTAPDASSG